MITKYYKILVIGLLRVIIGSFFHNVKFFTYNIKWVTWIAASEEMA
jgi:hypothetical protein